MHLGDLVAYFNDVSECADQTAYFVDLLWHILPTVLPAQGSGWWELHGVDALCANWTVQLHWGTGVLSTDWCNNHLEFSYYRPQGTDIIKTNIYYSIICSS